MAINIREVLSFVMMSTGSIMLFAYIVMTTHVYHGNKNAWLMTLIVLLFASQICVIVMGYSFYALFTEKDETMLNIWLFGVSIGGYYTFFNIAHFLLAIKYSTIAKEVPKMLEKGDDFVPEEETKSEKVVYWTLFIFNIVSGVSYGLSLVPYYKITLIETEEEVTIGLKVFRIFTTFWVRLMSVASGVILIRSVMQIRKFFAENEGE